MKTLGLLVLVLTGCGAPEINSPTATESGAIVEGEHCAKLDVITCQDGKVFACSRFFYLNGHGLKFAPKPDDQIWVENGTCEGSPF